MAKMLIREKKNLISGLSFISPWIIGLIVFTSYPLLSALYFSFTKYNILKASVWIGLKNYTRIFNDKLFYQSLGNTAYMIIIGLSISLVFTMLIAIMLDDRRTKGKSFFRVVFSIPTLVPLVVLCVLWMRMLHPGVGPINAILSFIRIEGRGWFADPKWAKPGFILMLIWGSGNMIIIFLAGLSDIPRYMYEAADIDGANFIFKIRHIMFPMLEPVLVFNILTGIIRILQYFAESFIITDGGPNGATNFYALYTYRNAFSYPGKMGYAFALTWIIIPITFLISFLLLQYEKKNRF